MPRPTWEASEHDPDAKHDVRGHDAEAPSHRDVIEHEPNPGGDGRSLSAAIGLLGALAILLAVGIDLAVAPFWNAVTVGVVLGVCGAYNAVRRSNGAAGSAGVAALAALLGAWMAVSPLFVPVEAGVAVGDGVATVSVVLLGLFALAVGTVSAGRAWRARREADARPTKVYDRRGH